MNIRHILFVFSVLVFYACANIGSPKGGPRDESPPVLQLDESTKNFQTNFKKQDITLVFNEFIEPKISVLLEPLFVSGAGDKVKSLVLHIYHK